MTQPSLNIHAPSALPEKAEQAYFDFATQQVIVADSPPKDLHVAGSVDNHNFVPKGLVEGEGDIGSGQGQPGWIELMDGSFHGAMTSRPPFKPYVEGRLKTDGGFSPSSRTVYY